MEKRQQIPQIEVAQRHLVETGAEKPFPYSLFHVVHNGYTMTWRGEPLRDFRVQYVLIANGEFRDEAGHYAPVRPGTLILRFPLVSQFLEFPEDSVIEHYSFRLPAELAQVWLQTGLISHDRPVLQLGYRDSIIRRIERLMRELRDCLDARLPEVARKIENFLGDIMSMQPESEPNDFLSEACSLLRSNLTTSLHIPDVVAELHMSYPTFRRRFRERTGISPGEYRIRCRIQKAKSLMDEQNYSLSEIAETLGYSEYSAFSRQFKKVTSTTPNRYSKRRHHTEPGA